MYFADKIDASYAAWKVNVDECNARLASGEIRPRLAGQCGGLCEDVWEGRLVRVVGGEE